MFTFNYIEKTKNKEKEAGNAPFLKSRLQKVAKKMS